MHIKLVHCDNARLRYFCLEIQRGSAGTAMPSCDYFSDDEIWQLVIYLRSMTGHD